MGTELTPNADEDRKPPYLAEEVAVLLRCSTRQVYRLAAEDKLDHFRVGSMVRFYPEPIDALLAGGPR